MTMPDIKELALTLVAVNSALGVVVGFFVYILRDKIVTFIINSLAQREADFDSLVVSSVRRQVPALHAIFGDGGIGEVKTLVQELKFRYDTLQLSINNLAEQITRQNEQYTKLLVATSRLEGRTDADK